MEELIHEAERLKADIARPPGKLIAPMSSTTYSGCDGAFFQSISHVDKQWREKIMGGESVDLLKLLPRSKVKKEDHRMEITGKGGESYVPVKMTDKDVLSIDSFKNGIKHSEFMQPSILEETHTEPANYWSILIP